MMSTRRSLFYGFKLVAAATLVLVPAIVHAQTNGTPAAVTATVTATAVQHDKLLVQWPGDYTQDTVGPHTAEYFEVGYAQTKATDFVGIKPEMMKVPGDIAARAATLTDLMSGKSYLVGVRAVNSKGAATAGGTDVSLDPVMPSAWVYAAPTPTGAAPKPGDVDHRDLTVMEGDMELVVEWARHPTPGATGLEIAGYMIEYSPMEDFSSGKLMVEVGAVGNYIEKCPSGREESAPVAGRTLDGQCVTRRGCFPTTASARSSGVAPRMLTSSSISALVGW